MTRRNAISISCILVILGAAISVFGQITTFSDRDIEFTFSIPAKEWRVIAKSPHVELNYNTERECNLEIRKVDYAASKPLSDLIRNEGEAKLQFLPGFVAGKEENFAGAMRGTIYNYEFVRSGRSMAGRFYFLRSGDVVYILRFTGFTDRLRALRTQTDLIARTFQLAAKKS